MNTRKLAVAAALLLSGLAAACSSPANEGPIEAIEPHGEGGSCDVTIGGDGDEATEDATYEAPPRFCAAAQEGDYAEFEDGEAELNFANEADD